MDAQIDTQTQRKSEFIFGAIFDIANKLQMLGDRNLHAAGLTTKQWYLIVIIDQFGDTPPSLGEVARAIGSSHQNVKQIALKLQQKGFLDIQKDNRDSRMLRLLLTEKNKQFWGQRSAEDVQFIRGLFAAMRAEEIDLLHQLIQKLHQHIANLVTQP